ncbi:hypothetical protein [Hymenobacter rigui]|uniref:Periplasmic heavy metal sensor n=1 Tax=Hymenobacter rigui TaxID=334424 RepID=A0A3R9NZG5_9BACT|nr:hypothetical protein [Hymenobacter rigui]RSK45241.1 hypothetical protein EI291_19205 [Hymenobacter rigui]
MKALFLLLLLAGLSTAAQAQLKDRYAERPGTTEPSAAQVERLTRTMSEQLQLNEAQIIQLRAVNKIKLARVEEIQWQYYDSPLERNAKLAELESQYETECSRILTPSQLSMFHDDRQRDAVPPQPTNPTDGGLG